MKVVNTHEAKTHFSKLLQLVQQGEEVIIAKAGQPVAELKRAPAKKAIKFGLWQDKDFEIPENINDPNEDLTNLFENSSISPE